MKESAREQIKLIANYKNGMAIACFAAGVLAPLLRSVPMDAREVIARVGLFAIGSLASLTLHVSAVKTLKALDED